MMLHGPAPAQSTPSTECDVPSISASLGYRLSDVCLIAQMLESIKYMFGQYTDNNYKVVF